MKVHQSIRHKTSLSEIHNVFSHSGAVCDTNAPSQYHQSLLKIAGI